MKKIHLTQEGQYSLVDDEDYVYLSQWSWSLNGSGYATSSVGFMHRVIINPAGGEVDHVNQNKLDNRKENLRVCTRSQNNANKRKSKNTSSKYKGVFYMGKNRWKSQIRMEGKSICLGTFEDEKYAALVYDVAARELFKEFADTNFPDEELKISLENHLNSVRSKTSKYRGVSFSVLESKWKAAITMNYYRNFLGTYEDEMSAALAVDEFLYSKGMFHKMNFPEML